MSEEWRDIPERSGYQASSHGRIRSIDRQINVASSASSSGYPRLVRGTVLRVWPDQQGYLQVRLGRNIHGKVHLLVAQAFHGSRPPGAEACHNDGDHLNNRPENIRWDTPSSNKLDTVRHGTHVQARKTHCPRRHELTHPNLTVWGIRVGKRSCLACYKAASFLRRHAGSDMQTESDRFYAELLGTSGKASRR